MFNQERIFRVFQLITALKRLPHKSIEELMVLLETSQRSTYRYFDLLRELGYDLQKDAEKRWFIADEGLSDLETFTHEENAYLRSLIKNYGDDSPAKQILLQKIALNSDSVIVSEDLKKIQLTKILENLKLGINSQTPVYLHGYHSYNSNTIMDRYVEPFGLTFDQRLLMAYEPKKKENKFFQIDRIGSVSIGEGSFKHANKHEIQEADAFGYAFGKTRQKIKCKLSVRAYISLLEQFPRALNNVTKKKRDPFYTLDIEVASQEPFERFRRGFDYGDVVDI